MGSAAVLKILCASTLTAAITTQGVTADQGADQPQIVNVTPNADLDTVAENIASTAGIDTDHVTIIDELNAIALPAGIPIVAVSRVDGVEQLVDDPTVHATVVQPSDTFFGQQWGLTLANVDDAWHRTTGSAAVTVAVLDTGVSEVPELSGKLLAGYDFINSDPDPSDDNGHGTQSATVIAANSDNASGSAGICWACKIIPVKVLNSQGTGTHSTIAQGLIWAADRGADIINMSLGGTASSALLDDAITYAVNAGSLVIASAGNNGIEQMFYPADSPGVVSIAASDETNSRYSWSNFSADRTDFAAPGCNIAQSFDSGFYWYCGTSSAAPFASGVAALALAANPNLDAAQLRLALEETAVPNTYTRFGNIDADRLLFTSPLVDPEPPTVTFVEPLPNRHLSGTFTATPAPVDNASIVRVHLYVDDVFAGESTAAPWEVDVDTGMFPSGSTTLRWRVFDRAGHVGVVQRDVLFDNEPPTVKFSVPYPSQPVSGSVILSPAATDDVAIHRVMLFADGEPVASSYNPPFNVIWDTTTSDEGPVVLKWRVADRIGNWAVVSRTVVVDRTAPSASIIWPNPGRLVRGVIGVRTGIFDSNGVATTALIVNGDIVSVHAGAPATITFDTAGLEGRAELVIRVIDKAGNITFSPIRVVSVDNTPPASMFVTPVHAAAVGGVVEVTTDISDSGQVSRALLFVNEQLVDEQTSDTSEYTFTFDAETFPAGPLTLKLVAFDQIGNRSVVSRTVNHVP